ncbi:MAG: hypothetical protein VX694_02510 [Planctomycetota bacterium]|nr:hypothetical protein [Planctomycetota bacterium]MEC7678116.1 hypothetical protein [Planctomycetota bacterium]
MEGKQRMLPISLTYMLYYFPLIIAIAIVFGATRHESIEMIQFHAWQTGKWITGFMGVIFIVLYVIGLIT